MSAKRPLIGIPADRRLLGPQAYHLAGEKYVVAALDAAGVDSGDRARAGPRAELRRLARFAPRTAVHGQPLERRAASLPGRAERGGHAPRSASRRDHPAADSARRRRRRAGARHLPRLPGDERRLRRHAVAAAAGSARSPRPSRGQGSSRSSSSTARRTRSRWRPAGCCSDWPAAPSACRSIHSTPRACANSGPGLTVEARASDGVIEAFRVTAARNFALAVQWHPEWRVLEEQVLDGVVCRIRRRLPSTECKPR